MSPDFAYRPATPADVPVMIENFVEGFETFRAFAPPGWEIPVDGSDEVKLAANVALPRAVAIVAESGGQPAGHVLLIPAELSREPVPDPQLAHVMHVFVRGTVPRQRCRARAVAAPDGRARGTTATSARASSRLPSRPARAASTSARAGTSRTARTTTRGSASTSSSTGAS